MVKNLSFSLYRTNTEEISLQ